MHTYIRKWANSAGIIPAPALAEAGFCWGDAVEIEAVAGKIVIKQSSTEYTVSELLKASPPEKMGLDEEDRHWLHGAQSVREN